MLHKSFKPAKCKTSLKLAVSRIKLLKNKKEVQVRQLKGELAKLLEAGQVPTARIRVEHVVREEKSKEAYELIEIFCELIVARMPMIESQKTCPIDLKESVSSVIFASPRCADIPELMDVRKHLKAKYGKEFVSGALELRPECGVNRMLVEKLSAKAPDGPTKLKILTAIAEEHNIKWDPNSFGDGNPPADLLNGPNSFGNASKIQESMGGQPSVGHNNKGSPSIQVSFKSDERHHKPEDSPMHSFRSTPPSQKSNFTDTNNASQSNINRHHIPETRSSEINSEGTHRHSKSGDQNNYSSGGQHWNMDFKDATSAAKAAAESAERASLAARAAAELSSRGNISQPQSSEFQKSSSYNLRAEGPQEYASSSLQDQRLSKDQVVSAPHSRNSMTDDNSKDNDTKRFMGDDANKFYSSSSSARNIDTNTSVPAFNASDRYSVKNSSEPGFSDSLGSASLEKQPSNFDASTSVPNFNASDRYSVKNSSEPGYSDTLSSASREKQRRNVDVEYVSDQPLGTGSESISSYGDVRIRNDSIRVSYHEKLGNDIYENPFAMDKPNDNENTVDKSLNDDASVVFDDYGPDDDYVPDDDYQRRESILEHSSLKGKLPANSSATIDPWIFEQNRYESPEKSVSHSQIFEERTSVFAGNPRTFEDPFQSNDLLPASFDHSDGPSSESEVESGESEIIGKENSSEFSKKQNLYSDKPEWDQNSSRESAGSSAEEKRLMIPHHLLSEISLVHESKEKDSPPSPRNIIQDTLLFEESTSESYSALSFGKLKGGLRNQKSNMRSYIKNSSGSDLPSKQASENDASETEQSTSIYSSTARTSFRSNAPSQETYDESVEEKPDEENGSRGKLNTFYSDLGDSKNTFIRSDQESFSDKVENVTSKRSTPRVAVKYPGFRNDDDSEEDSPTPNMKNSPRVTGLSRRTKASPRSSSSYSEDSHGKPTSHDDVTERTASRSSYASTAPLKVKTGTRYSDHLENSEQPRSSKPFKQTPETKRFNEERLKSSAKEQQSNYPPELGRQGSSESSKSSFSRETTTASVKTTWARRTNSGDVVNSEQPQRMKPSKPIPEPKRSFHEERSTSSTKEPPSNPSLKSETQGNSESSKRDKTREDEKKPSHVHPNLPDYDNFAAHFLALRQNHKYSYGGSFQPVRRAISILRTTASALTRDVTKL